MRAFISLVAMIACATCGEAQTRSTPHAWRATIKVMDDAGQPVSGAETWVSYSLPVLDGHSKNWDKISGVSDANGVFIASHVDQTVAIGFHAQKPGYYWTAASHEFGFTAEDPKVDWNPVQTLVLNRIIHPIPMYAKRVNLGMPVFDKPAEFDLIVGDWVSPYGTGLNADIIFTAHREKRAQDDSDYTLKVSFRNPADGIQPFPPPNRASFIYDAPLAGYQPAWVQTKTRRPGQPMEENWNPSRNYFFRVRTELDHQGNVVSAHYGKIYGDFMQFTYYFNPTPNDRNMEFDPKKNLFAGVKSFEEVTAP